MIRKMKSNGCVFFSCSHNREKKITAIFEHILNSLCYGMQKCMISCAEIVCRKLGMQSEL